MNEEKVARAIRAALEELVIMGGDNQGPFVADVFLDYFDDAEKAALEVLKND